MPEVAEFRYPFASLYEFVRYVGDPAALHLVIAWALILGLILKLAFTKGFGVPSKLVALYFSLTMFNNPAFRLAAGSTLGDVFGLACFGYCCFRLIANPARKINFSPVGSCVLIAAVLMSIHALIVTIFYPVLNDSSRFVWGDAAFENTNVILLRAMVMFKVFVFGACCLLFSSTFRTADEIWWLIRQVVNFAVVGVLVYFIQACVLLSGTMPYGLFFDAGYVGFPAFGSVSIERGHFGKFLTPLFPIFLLAAMRQKRGKAFLSFIAVTMANFSASSLSFFAVYVISSLYAFKRKLLRPKLAVAACCILLGLMGFVCSTWELWLGLAEKISVQALNSDGHGQGGRTVGLALSYLASYPLGISYSGSSLRTAPGLDEINSGLLAFITQESALALVLISGFLVLLWSGWRAAGEIRDKCARRIIQSGLVAMPFIFAADILWFVPTVWLPLLLAFAMAKAKITMPIANLSSKRLPFLHKLAITYAGEQHSPA